MQTPLMRRKMLIRAGLADALPPLAERRSWEFIDDRIPPTGDPDGQFDSHVQWINKASSWIGWTGARSYDAQDRPCRGGADMARAKEENAFPVRWYWPERFAPPVIPSVPTMRIRNAVALAGAAGILQDELRQRQGMKSISRKAIEAALEGRAQLVEQRWTMTADGIEQTKFELEQARRASWVRN